MICYGVVYTSWTTQRQVSLYDLYALLLVYITGFCAVFEHVNEGDPLDHEVLLLANNLFA